MPLSYSKWDNLELSDDDEAAPKARGATGQMRAVSLGGDWEEEITGMTPDAVFELLSQKLGSAEMGACPPPWGLCWGRCREAR